MDKTVTEDRPVPPVSVYLSAAKNHPGGPHLLFMTIKLSGTQKGYWLCSLHNLKST